MKKLKTCFKYGQIYIYSVHSFISFFEKMKKSEIKKIFSHYKLGQVEDIYKIEVGFTNKVYSINENFILKVCEDVENEVNFRKEVFFYDLFKESLPVPKISVYDNTKGLYDKDFIIYPKIQGDNLYSKWHLMSDNERKNMIKQLCQILKTINATPYKQYLKEFKISEKTIWHDKIVNEINSSLKHIEKESLLPDEFSSAIRKFVKQNHEVLREQKMGLVYWDSHFDNILVRNNKIVGILDFERTEFLSIDFVLDIVKRMQEFPSKYMSEESEKFAKKKDYQNLLKWFEIFYPELFKFKNLDKRLALYTLEHDLKDIIGWPNVKELKEIVAKTIKYTKTISTLC